MAAFRILLVAILAIILGYTGIVIANHGWGLLPIFFGDMARMGWPGQFNLDFMFLLSLSGLWVAWRHGFSAAGILLGILAFNLGAAFLSAYLLIVSAQTNGDMRAMLLGTMRAG